MAQFSDDSECEQNPTFLYDALYCSEESWEAEESIFRGDWFLESEEGKSCYCFENADNKQTNPPMLLLEHDMSWESEELSSLFAKEEHNQLYRSLETNPSLARARQEAVEWMLKVNARYNFTALTAVLAVNYLDRFLFSFHPQTEKSWMPQLAAVACLSLAAKIEETQVPLLLDLQVEDSRFVFEAKTIQRMEILVLSTLQWRMNPVTPLSFLDYMARRLGVKDYFLCWEFLRRCERIVVSLISDSRSVPYLPSVMATATMLHIINGVEPCHGAEYQSQLLGILGIDKDKVEGCSKLIRKLAFKDYYYIGSYSHKRKIGCIPSSPNGVIDASFSSDSSNDSWAVASSSSTSSSVSSSPEPLSKKRKAMPSSDNASTTDFPQHSTLEGSPKRLSFF